MGLAREVEVGLGRKGFGSVTKLDANAMDERKRKLTRKFEKNKRKVRNVLGLGFRFGLEAERGDRK